MSLDIELANALVEANQYLKLKSANAKLAAILRGRMLYWQGTLLTKGTALLGSLLNPLRV